MSQPSAADQAAAQAVAGVLAGDQKGAKKAKQAKAAGTIQKAWKGFKGRFSRSGSAEDHTGIPDAGDEKAEHAKVGHSRTFSRLERQNRMRLLTSLSVRIIKDMVASPADAKANVPTASRDSSNTSNGSGDPFGVPMVARQKSEAVYDDVMDAEARGPDMPVHRIVAGLMEPSDQDTANEAKISLSGSGDHLPLLRQRTQPAFNGWVLTAEKRGRGPLEQFYQLQDQAGPAGAYGQVFYAMDLASNEQRAVKVIKKRYKTPDQLASFGNEIALMLASDHPNVLKAIDAFETKDDLFIVMEACKGGDLCTHLDELNYKNQRYSEVEIARIMRDVLMGLRYLHKHKWGHFDLKPDNIMFDSDAPDATLKLIDFGMTRFWNAKEREVLSSSIGTIVYNAPEVLDGHYNIHADMWSVGVILFMMLFGYAPFNEPNSCGPSALPDARKRLKAKIQAGFIPEHRPGQGPWFPKGAKPVRSPEVLDLITQLLQPDWTKRPTATEALEHPWLRGKASSEMLPPEVIRTLHSFDAANKFQQHALHLMVDLLSESELKELKGAFERLDKDHDNRISLEEFYTTVCEQIESSPYMGTDPAESFRTESWELEREQLEETFKAIDLNNDGFISYDELLIAAIHTKVMAVEGRMREMFRRLRAPNAAGDMIKVADLVKVLGVEEKEAKELIAEADKNQNQEVDYEEFLDMWRVNARRAPSEF